VDQADQIGCVGMLALLAGTGLKQQAWEWAVTQCGVDGTLPTGRAIAD
jgi:hypothetical protein